VQGPQAADASGRAPLRLVVGHADRKGQRALARLLGATRRTVDVVADIVGDPDAIDGNAIVVVDQALAVAHPEVARRAARAWIAVPSDDDTPADPGVIGALLDAGWRHVCAHPMPILAEELLATVQKVTRADIFGLEKYVSWGAEIRRFVLDDARERDQAVAALTRDVVAAGLPDRVGSLVSVIAYELLANAIYTAPVDDDGERFRRGEPRDRQRALTGRDAVTLRWATDGRYLAIEVRDGWGTLDPEHVGGRLARAGQQSPAPADAALDRGMGLALAYACCNQLVIDVDPGKTTEAIALIDVRYKPTELARSASYHAFVQSGDPP
jgi:hypothetical protein